MAIGLADAPHALEGTLVAHVPAERITRVGRIRDQPPGTHQLSRPADEACLRVDRMQLQVFGQVKTRGSQARRVTIYAALCRLYPGFSALMQALAEFAPLVAFFVTYSLRGLYAATGVLMAAMLALLVFDWLRLRRIPPLHAVSALLVLVLGGATLLLHNRLFIQWKPTVLFWVVSIAFVASSRIGERTLTQRFLEPALGGRVTVSPQQWRRINVWSALFYLLLGALNLAVAYGASERTWVYFKLFGLALLTFAFVALQVLWVSRAAGALPSPASDAPQ
jgi:intracellular septation protein